MADEKPVIAERRARQREALVAAAERRIADAGLAGLKAREIAAAVGIALGAIYNLFEDMDEVVLRVSSRTLARLDRALEVAVGATAPAGPSAAVERLVAVARAYLDFAAANRRLWNALFEHRLPPGKPTPDWSLADQRRPLRHILVPVRNLRPDLATPSLETLVRMLFSAAHGVVVLGLDQKLAEEPITAIRAQIETLVRATCRGLLAEVAD